MRIDANESERDIEQVGFRFYAMGLRYAFVFEFGVVAEIHQQTKLKTGCVQIVQQLCAVLVG